MERTRAPAGTEAVGPEQGFVFTKGRHKSQVQDLRGLEEFSLLVCALLMGADGFTWNSCCPLQLGVLNTFPSPPCSQQAGEVGKHQKLSKEKHPKLRFTELIHGGEGCGQPQILSPSFSQPPLTRSILPRPQLGCQAVWFARREGPSSGWGWEPLSCPTLCESDPICSGRLSGLSQQLAFLSVLMCLFWFSSGSITRGALCSPTGMDQHWRERSWAVIFPLPGNVKGWGQTGAGTEIQVPKEQEAGAAKQDLSSPCSAPYPEPPFPTQQSKAPSTQEPLMFFSSSKVSLGPPPFSSLANQSQHWWGGVVGTRLECLSHPTPTTPGGRAKEVLGLLSTHPGEISVPHRAGESSL